MPSGPPSYDIPSNFIRLDSRVTDPDAFANIRDLQVLRLNHNKLIARGIKRNIATFVGCYGRMWDGSFGTIRRVIWSCRQATKKDGKIAFSLPVMISPYTKEVHVVLRARCYDAAMNANIYCTLDTNERSVDIDYTTPSMNVTSAANLGEKVSVTLPVPTEAARTGLVTINGHLEGRVNFTTPHFGGFATVIGYGAKYVDVDTTGLPVTIPTAEEALIMNTGSFIPNIVINYASLTGANQWRLYLENPVMGKGFAQAEIYECTGLTILSGNVYESSVSSFDYDPVVP